MIVSLFCLQMLRPGFSSLIFPSLLLNSCSNIILSDPNELNYDLNSNYRQVWKYFRDENGISTVDYSEPISIELATLTFGRSSLWVDDLPTKVTFYFYEQDNKDNGAVIPPAIINIENSRINKTKPTKFLIHGFLSSYLSSFVQELKDEYLSNFDYNIIVVDWAPIAEVKFYPFPMAATKSVGQYVAKFIDILIKLKFDSMTIHLLGHSLGAHVAGFAGQLITIGKVGRVTGLDPAGPGYITGILTGGKISRESANFVDIIHTCVNILGLYESLGHADYWPNGGLSPQPGCGSDSMEARDCSHGRSWQYFKESIRNSDAFHSRSCSTFQKFLEHDCGREQSVMGEAASHQARGDFYLLTNLKRPFTMQSIYHLLNTLL